MCNFLTRSEPYSGCCAWVQASERFSKKRLGQMFEAHPKKVSFLGKNILVAPNKKPCSTYAEKSLLIENIVSGNFFLPPELRFLVIDNVSHHLRFETSKASSVETKCALLNDFFESQISELLFFCANRGVRLILIHEITFNPESNKNEPFFNKLYSRMDCLTLSLERDLINRISQITIQVDGLQETLNYRLIKEGFEWS